MVNALLGLGVGLAVAVAGLVLVTSKETLNGCGRGIIREDPMEDQGACWEVFC